MKDYDEYTPEEIEDLARECERLAEEICRLQDQVYYLTEQLIDLRHGPATPRKEHGETPLDSELPF